MVIEWLLGLFLIHLTWASAVLAPRAEKAFLYTVKHCILVNRVSLCPDDDPHILTMRPSGAWVLEVHAGFDPGPNPYSPMLPRFHQYFFWDGHIPILSFDKNFCLADDFGWPVPFNIFGSCCDESHNTYTPKMPNPYKTENYRKNEVLEDKKADTRLDETTDPQNAMLSDHPPDVQAAGDDGYLVNDNKAET